MNSLRARRTAVAVMAAFLIPTIAITTAAQTIEFEALEWLFPSLEMSHVEGSVLSADSTATTVKIDCRPLFTNQCKSSAYTLPQTFTSGPSIQGKNLEETSYLARKTTFVSVSIHCDITSTSLGASCAKATTSWGSFASSTVSNLVHLSPTLPYKTLAVMSGLEKLRTTSTAAPSAPTATATSVASTPEKSSSSSSEAWIAGPVIGGVAGVAFAAGLVFWLIRRRRKSIAGVEDVPPQELPANHQPKELSELPENTAPVELPGRSSHDKAQSPARNSTHELALE
ncbi:unnamed protein product [Penicillium pancosmium]